MSDLALLMKEMGGTDSGKVQVEHLLVFTLSDSTDRLVRAMAGTLQAFGREIVQSIRIMAIGTAIGASLYGTARLIEAIRGGKEKRREF